MNVDRAVLTLAGSMVLQVSRLPGLSAPIGCFLPPLSEQTCSKRHLRASVRRPSFSASSA